MNHDDDRPVKVSLWLIETDQNFSADEIQLFDSWLSPDEQKRRQRFYFEKDRLRFLLCRALMRDVLSRHVGLTPQELQFFSNEWGKPFLAESGGKQLNFNLSHTDGLGVLAVSEQAVVGVDVENPKRHTETLAVAERFFSPEECLQFEGLDEMQVKERFFAFWTLKEAYIKAVGKGLQIPLDSFSFYLKGRGISVGFSEKQPDNAESWRFLRMAYAHSYPIALAAKKAAPMALSARVGKPAGEFTRARLEFLGSS